MTMYMYHIRQSGDWHPPRRSLETNAEQQFFLMEHYGQPGVTPLTHKGELSVYPNPAHDEVNVTSVNKITEITITNVVGQCVHSHTCNNSSVQINIAELPTGIYFMKMMDETGVTTVVRVVKSGQ